MVHSEGQSAQGSLRPDSRDPRAGRLSKARFETSLANSLSYGSHIQAGSFHFKGLDKCRKPARYVSPFLTGCREPFPQPLSGLSVAATWIAGDY